MKKFTAAILLLVIAFSLPCMALTENVSVYVDGEVLYDNEPLLIDNTTYVEMSAFRRAAGDTSDSEVIAFDNYITGEGRYIYTDANCFTLDSGVYVPLRTITKLYGGRVEWDSETMSARVFDVETIISGDQYYDAEDLYWLSRIISAESRGEPIKGKLAVGNVVMNRLASEEFPDTVYGVIFDRKYGVQFTPVANGQIYKTPTYESVIAAKMILDGYKISDSILYFIYEAIATNFWTVYNRGYEFTIGCHDFYS